MFNANILVGTGELQNRKQLIGLVGVCGESRCNSACGVVTYSGTSSVHLSHPFPGEWPAAVQYPGTGSRSSAVHLIRGTK